MAEAARPPELQSLANRGDAEAFACVDRPRKAVVARDATSLVADLPRPLKPLMRKINRPDFVAKLRLEDSDGIIRSVKTVGDLTFMGLLIGSLLIAGAISLNFQTTYTIFGLPAISALFFGLAWFHSFLAFYKYIRR